MMHTKRFFLGCLILICIVIGAGSILRFERTLADETAPAPAIPMTLWFPQMLRGVTPTPLPPSEPHLVFSELRWYRTGVDNILVGAVVQNSSDQSIELHEATAYFLNATGQVQGTETVTAPSRWIPLDVVGPGLDAPILLGFPYGRDGPPENRLITDMRMVVTGHITSTRVVTLTILDVRRNCGSCGDPPSHCCIVDIRGQNDSGRTVGNPRIVVREADGYNLSIFPHQDLPSQLISGEIFLAGSYGGSDGISGIWAIAYPLG